MSEFRFALAHYAALVALAVLAYHLGRVLTRRLPYASVTEEIACSTSVGLGAVAYIVMALGVLDLLYTTVVTAVLVAIAGACLPVWIQSARRLSLAGARSLAFIRARPLMAGAAAIGAALVLLPLLQLPLYPPTTFDSTMYHLVVAKTYVREHGLVLTPDLRYPIFPQTPHMLFTLLLLLFDDVAAQLTQLLALGLTAAALVAFAAREGLPRAGWFAAALLVSNPLVVWVSSTAYVDTTVVMFTTVMTAAFWNWLRTRMRGWLVLAGVCGGLAVSVKLPAMFFVGLFALLALIAGPRRHARDSALLLLIAGFVASPWLARNAYYTSNPFFPVLRDVFGAAFGYGVLDGADYEQLFGDFPSYGFGRSLGALLMLPWNLATSPGRFAAPAPLSITMFLVLPVLLVGVWRSRVVRALATIAALFTLFWFFTGQEMRYLLPALPILCLALGVSIAVAGANRTAGILPIALSAVLLAPGWMYATGTVKAAGPLPTMQAERDAYLQRHLPSYEAYLLLRGLGVRNYTVYAIQDENLKYYADGRQLGDYFGPGRYDLIWGKLGNPRALHRALRSFGADYLVVNHQRAPVPLLIDERFSRWFTTLLPGPTVWVFRLTTDPAVLVQDEELLVNGGFETLEAGRPLGWTVAGEAIVDTSGTNSATGTVAVRCIGPAHVVFQVVDVSPGGEYVLRFSARGFGMGQTARRQVNWLDRDWRFLSTSLEVLNVTDAWRRYEMRAVAPDGAGHAVVYASCDGSGSAWFDDMSFIEAARR